MPTKQGVALGMLEHPDITNTDRSPRRPLSVSPFVRSNSLYPCFIRGSETLNEFALSVFHPWLKTSFSFHPWLKNCGGHGRALAATTRQPGCTSFALEFLYFHI